MSNHNPRAFLHPKEREWQPVILLSS